MARSIGFDVVPYKGELDAGHEALELMMMLRTALLEADAAERDFLLKCGRFIDKSKSQLLQDIFALHATNFKSAGFFVEFGATNGIGLSNTYLLEKEFGWRGILAEPAKVWAGALQANRTCSIDLRCVWKASGEKLQFLEASDAELSTIGAFGGRDEHAAERRKNETYEVETVSLEDLLRFHDAPYEIDYLSIDTEGSEYEIISRFDFDKYRFKAITIEHNYIEHDRNRIYELLASHGYVRVFENLSQWDDWYIKECKERSPSGV